MKGESLRGPGKMRLEVKQQSRDGNGAVGLELVKHALVLLLRTSPMRCRRSDDGVCEEAGSLVALG